MQNKILINTGFYLLLLLAFSITIFPIASYLLALVVFAIWFADFLIFREPSVLERPLFYPIVGLNFFILLSWILSRIHGGDSHLLVLGVPFLFYLIIPGFVVTGEQRKMLLWTFIGGVVLSTGFAFSNWWSFAPDYMEAFLIKQPLLSLIVVAFCIVAGFYAEAPDFRDRLFLGLVALPFAAAMILSLDKAATMALFLSLLLVALIKGRDVLLPTAAMTLLLIVVFAGIGYFTESKLALKEYAVFVLNPFERIGDSPHVLANAGFFGDATLDSGIGKADYSGDYFFLGLITRSGPPVFLLILWILIERARESFFKRRKVTDVEVRSYHMSVLLIIFALIILNTYGNAFEFPQVLLISSFILGVSEI